MLPTNIVSTASTQSSLAIESGKTQWASPDMLT